MPLQPAHCTEYGGPENNYGALDAFLPSSQLDVVASYCESYEKGAEYISHEVIFPASFHHQASGLTIGTALRWSMIGRLPW
jgi:hypothetical protein